MTHKRHRKHEQLEQQVLEQMRQRGSGWVTSRELACEIGYPCPGVARALLRLASCRTVDIQATTWLSNKSRIRRCNVYRLVEIKATYPSWLMPQAVVPVVGTGRVIKMKD